VSEYVEPTGVEEPHVLEQLAPLRREPSRAFFVLFLSVVLTLYVLLAWLLYAALQFVFQIT